MLKALWVFRMLQYDLKVEPLKKNRIKVENELHSYLVK
jgi:uncharacterized protein YdcH (DUF465 family)